MFRGLGTGSIADLAARLPLRAVSAPSAGIYAQVAVPALANCKGISTLFGSALSGTVDLGEYGKANFTAKRHWRT